MQTSISSVSSQSYVSYLVVAQLLLGALEPFKSLQAARQGTQIFFLLSLLKKSIYYTV